MTAVVMLIGIALMIVIHEGGHFLAAKWFDMKATEAFFGFGPRIWSTTRGETEYGLKAIPFGGYVRIIGMNPLEEIPPEEEARTYRAAPFWQKSVVVLAGIASHLIMAFLLFLLVFSVWGQRAENADGELIPTTVLSIVPEVTPDGDPSPAHDAGFQAGDVVTSFDGRPVDSWDAFVDEIRVNGGNTVTVAYTRDGVPSEATLTLATIDSPDEEEGRIGYFGAAPEVERIDAGVLANIGAAFRSVGRAIVESFAGLWAMITGLPDLLLGIAGDDPEAIQDVRPITPIGLARIAGPLESTLVLLAMVNVFVAIVNVIPLYPLDGGHFAVALYEKVTGREPDVRKLMPVAAVVLVFLVTVGLVGLYLDIFRPLQL